MIFYILVTAILMTLAWISRNSPEVSHKYFKVTILVVFIIVAFRFDVGCDWGSYLIHFERQTAGVFADTITPIEPAYWLMLDAVHYLGLPYETLNVLISLIFFLGLYCLGRTQPNPMTVLAMAFPILIFALPMSAIRQAAAMGFIMIGLVFFVRRKLFMFCAMIFAGFLFHTSAIAFILIAPFLRIKLSIRNLVLISPLLLIILFGLSNIEGAEVASERYLDNAKNDAEGGVFRTFLLLISGIIFLLMVKKKWHERNKPDYNLVLMGGCMLCIPFLFITIAPTIADRFGYYFIIFQAIIVARLNYIDIEHADILLGLFFIGTISFFVIWWTLSWQLPYCYEPYQNVLIRNYF